MAHYLLGVGAEMGQSTEVILPHQLSLFPQKPYYQEALVTWECNEDEGDHQEHQVKAWFFGLRAGFVILLCVLIASWNFGRMGHR